MDQRINLTGEVAVPFVGSPADPEVPFVFPAEPHTPFVDAEATDATVAEENVAAVEPAPAEPLTEGDKVETESLGRLKKIWNGIRHNKVAAAAGAITVGSMVASPMGETLKGLVEAAPYAGSGMVAAEAAWIGGAAMMLASIGKKIWNPLKIRSRFSEIPEAAAQSKLFKAGLAVNTAAAVAEFVIPTIAVTTKMPVESWGVLSFSTLDLFATVAIRRMIWRGMHKTPESSEA